MPYLLILLMTSVLGASEQFQADALVFGLSYHFHNRDDYNFNERNLGIGAALWYSPHETVSYGAVVADCKNSYYNTSFVRALVIKKTFGDPRELHVGGYGGLGSTTGYNYSQRARPMGAVFIGYDRINLDVTYTPLGMTDAVNSPPISAAVICWLRITLTEF